MYDLAFAFWSRLATERAELPGGAALANGEVPYLLSNAAWYPQPGALAGVAAWYAARELPPALIAPALKDADLERALDEGPFMLEQGFSFRPAEAAGGALVTEQASWSQSRAAGELLAGAYAQPGLALPIAGGLTRALQEDSRVQLYLAYGETPVGTLLVFETDAALTATLSVDPDGSLETRLVQEAGDRGLSPFVLEALPEGVLERSARGLERWSIR